MREMLEEPVLGELEPLKERVASMIDTYEKSVAAVKEAGDQEVQDFLARRLYDMTGEIMMSLLILADATAAPDLFLRSAKVYVRMAEETVAGKSAYIFSFDKEELPSFRAVKE